MRDGFTRAPTGGFGRIGVALCPSATASKALARATWAAGSACERLMRTSQTRSWSVSFRRGSFWRRLIGKPPGEVEELAAYSTFARIATSMSSDPLVGYQHFTPVPRFAPECETVCLREPIEMAGVNAGFVGAPQRPSSGVVKDRLPFRYLAPSAAETHSPHGPPLSRTRSSSYSRFPPEPALSIQPVAERDGFARPGHVRDARKDGPNGATEIRSAGGAGSEQVAAGRLRDRGGA